MRISKNIFLIAFFSLTICSCRWITSASTPFYTWTNFKIPDGTPIFQSGFKDGCSSILYARGNDFYRSRYSYRYNTALIGNTEYRFGYQRGGSWCFQTILAAQTGPRGGGLSKFFFIYGNESSGTDPSPGNINSTGLFGDPNGYSLFSDNNTSSLDGIFNVLQKGSDASGVGGVGETTFGTNPMWSGGSRGSFLGWDK